MKLILNKILLPRCVVLVSVAIVSCLVQSEWHSVLLCVAKL